MQKIARDGNFVAWNPLSENHIGEEGTPPPQIAEKCIERKMFVSSFSKISVQNSFRSEKKTFSALHVGYTQNWDVSSDFTETRRYQI
jgi:hypothetical protein